MLYHLTQTMYLLRVTAVIFKSPLGDDASSVKSLVDPVDGDTVYLHAIFHCLFHGMGTPESRQQGRVDIDYASVIAGEEYVSDDAHIACKAYQVYPEGIHSVSDFALEIRFGGVVLRTEDESGRPELSGTFNHESTGFVTNQKNDFRIQPSVSASRRYSLIVASASACKYRQFFHLSMILTPGVPVILPMTDAFSPYDSRMEMTLDDSDFLTASTIPIPILKMLNISL